MSFIIRQSGDELSKSFALNQKVDIKSVRLAAAHVSSHLPPAEPTLPLSQTIGFRVLNIGRSASGDTDMLVVTVDFSCRVIDSASEPANLLDLSVTYDLLYGMEKGYQPQPDDVSAFASGNAIFNAWPYFREHAHHVGLRCGVPMNLIPFLRVEVANTQASPEEAK